MSVMGDRRDGWVSGSIVIPHHTVVDVVSVSVHVPLLCFMYNKYFTAGVRTYQLSTLHCTVFVWLSRGCGNRVCMCSRGTCQITDPTSFWMYVRTYILEEERGEGKGREGRGEEGRGGEASWLLYIY